MIRCLPEEVQACFRSGVAINSLGQCAEELVLNSIDAKATCVAVRVDLETLKIQVVDNGCGMGKEDLSKVGNRYFTSKCCSVEDLENLRFYGFRGEALASIANMASILEISSKTNKIAKSFLKMFHNGKGLEVCETELNRPSAGTTVAVYNLFCHLPVRRKCMDSILELERVRHKIEAISLIHPFVSFSLRNDTSCSMMLQLSKTKDMCSRFSQIYGLSKSQKLREINYKSGGFEISGFVSTEGHYNKNIQFLYVNNRLVLKTRLHKLIDFLLRKQSVISKAKSGSLTSSPARHRSGSELYGVFVINVKCQYDEYDVCLEPAKTLIEFRNWAALLTCIEEGIKAFLKREHLYIELCGEDIKEFNENNGFCLDNAVALQTSIPEETGRQESFKRACDNIVDSYEMFNLQSKSVKRKIILAKTASDHTEPINNVERVGICPDLTGTNEAVLELENSKADNLLSNKNGTTPNLPELNNLQETSCILVNPQTEVTSSKLPQECDGQDRSVALEIDNHASTSLCTEKSDKDISNQQDEAFRESGLNSVTAEHAGMVEDANEFKYEFVLGCDLQGKYKTVKEDKELSTGSDTNGAEVMGWGPMRLCSTGLITHLVQNQQQPHSARERNGPLSRQSKLGPVSARDVFENRQGFLGQVLNSQEYLKITNKRNPTESTDECIEMGNLSNQKNKVGSVHVNDNVGLGAPYIKKNSSVGSSGSVPLLDSATKCRQMAELSLKPTSGGFTKLSLHRKLGSLDRFKRHYGNIKSTSSIADMEKRAEDEIPVCGRFLNDVNTDIQRCIICETPNKDSVSNNRASDCLVSFKKSQHSMGEKLLNGKAFNVSPVTPEDSLQIRKKNVSDTEITGTLASKLSQMKKSLQGVSSTESTGPSSEQSQAWSRQNDENIWKLSSQNNVLQSTCQIPQFSQREEWTESCSFASTSNEQVNDMGSSSRRSEDVEDTVRHSFIGTDGEYTVSQNKTLTLSDREVDSDGSCEDVGIMNESTKQAVKVYESQSMIVSSNLEDATDDSNAVDNEKPQLHSFEWLHQFDASLGKTVYINPMTGLSTYNAPSGDSQAVCAKDISTMAVNVIENGFQCRCHPFRSELIVPFLPRPQTERSFASQAFRDTSGESVQSLLSEWDNPVFAHCPEFAVNVNSGQADNLAVKIHNILYPYRFTKKMIHSVQVLNQVDSKFIACLINTRTDENEDADSYEKQSETLGRKKLLASTVCPPLEIEITEDQRRLLRCWHKSLEDLGLELFFPENQLSQILVGKVPLCFVEREANELRRGRQTVAKSIVQEFIQEQAELLQTTGGAQGTLPLTILKVLASQACHGAIKFNDNLTFEDCCCLMKSLSCCHLPFQCAHGRPSMLPLADVDHLQQESQPKPNLAKLRRMAKAWQLLGKENDPSGKS
ncbi:DNA mismatch repair protein Mlh3 isoform X2 [Sceloporus undulatus]|uniref:DNA mismatch repair protein Mlh3 isoform X2 n=1 Tax=Sceloporus undulatus TaxID=8520 RepID=UPI001C4D14AC|nr:DNA mismatch repair protein Mlh3 isoform X2 [Sceloporus undulatus]